MNLTSFLGQSQMNLIFEEIKQLNFKNQKVKPEIKIYQNHGLFLLQLFVTIYTQKNIDKPLKL